ncbi:MAG: GGDEF domain-containing protein, partial [Lachnospiraceae bacterium]|nr:GGDEF domain-containing protein [Lachnospiraceae bacterium]
LACNQAFAEYVHKKDPSEVVGHTTREIFDEAMVKSSEEDDQIALSMEGPYVYFDELPDADGVKRQVKVTKMKYTDANGKLCLLGMYQDVTDSFRISRNNARDKESYEKARSSGVIFTHIAQTLARGYVALYYVDLNTEEFIEFSTDAETGSLVEANRGWHFFEECLDEIDEYVYKDDTDAVTEAMDRRTLVAELDKNDTFMMTFRIKGKKEPQYVSMKVTRMQDDERYIILGITDVNEQMKEHNVATKLREEQTAYNRITALAGEFLFIWVVNPENGHYREFSTANGFEAIDRFVEGQDFFADSREKAQKLLYPDDIDRFVSGLTRENVLGEVESNGIYTLSYRLLKDGEPRYVQLKAAIVVEDEGARLIVGINDIDAQVRQEEEYGRRLAQARIEANIDALTGVKNRNAYRVYEDRLNAQIELERSPEFAITILDVNDLKKVNDTQGHKAGDQFLRDACKIICTTFKRSPVFRVGGDEFAVLSQGDDYECIEELIGQMNRHNEEALENGGVVIAVGMARYMGDPNVAPVYERADKYMYDNKSELKARKKQRG